MRRTLLPQLASLLLTASLLTACRGREASAPAASTRPAASQSTFPREGGTLLRRLDGDVESLNPLLSSSEYEKNVLSCIFDPLIDVDDSLRPVAGLATSWTVSDDRKSYTFELNPRATFSDGVAVKPSDVVFTMKKIVDPASGAAQLASLFEGLDPVGTRATGPHSVAIAFNTARASQLPSFNIPILPEHVYGTGNFRNDFNDKAVGSGPYTLVIRERGSGIHLRRREGYWRRKPYVQDVEFKVITSDPVAWNAMKKGEIDEMRVKSDIWKLEKDNPAIKQVMDIRSFYFLNYNFIAWNTRDPLLSDKKVRRALAMCLDRVSIINNIYFGSARMITGPFTPDQWAYNPRVPAIPYDPAGARAALVSAGWTDSNQDGLLDRSGKPLRVEMLISSGSSSSAEQAQIFQASLKQAGVQLDLVRLDSPTLFGRVGKGAFQSAFLGWTLDADPDLHANFHSSQSAPAGSNFSLYSNPEADALIIKGREEFDFNRRREIYQRLHEILAEDQPWTWIVQVSTKWALNKRVKNVRVSNGYGPFLWYPAQFDWWLATQPAVEAK